MPGPVPKREEELARPRSRKGGDQQEVTHGELREVSHRLDPSPDWDPMVVNLYNSALTSGQSDFYQDSDWAKFYVLCHELHHYMHPPEWADKDGVLHAGKRNGQILTAIMSGLESLLLTEGDRRRVRLELQKPPEEKTDLKVVAMDAYRGVATK